MFPSSQTLLLFLYIIFRLTLLNLLLFTSLPLFFYSTAADGNLSNLQTFYDRGVRMIGLIWNYENCMGYPSSNSPVEHARGLKSFGLESVAEMNRSSII